MILKYHTSKTEFKTIINDDIRRVDILTLQFVKKYIDQS